MCGERKQRELQAYTLFWGSNVEIFWNWQLLNLEKHPENSCKEASFRNSFPETGKTVILTLLFSFFFLTFFSEIGKYHWLHYSTTHTQTDCLVSRVEGTSCLILTQETLQGTLVPSSIRKCQNPLLFSLGSLLATAFAWAFKWPVQVLEVIWWNSARRCLLSL